MFEIISTMKVKEKKYRQPYEIKGNKMLLMVCFIHIILSEQFSTVSLNQQMTNKKDEWLLC